MGLSPVQFPLSLLVYIGGLAVSLPLWGLGLLRASGICLIAGLAALRSERRFSLVPAYPLAASAIALGCGTIIMGAETLLIGSFALSGAR